MHWCKKIAFYLSAKILAQYFLNLQTKTCNVKEKLHNQVLVVFFAFYFLIYPLELLCVLYEPNNVVFLLMVYYLYYNNVVTSQQF